MIEYFIDALTRPLSTTESFEVRGLALIVIGLPIFIIAVAVRAYMEYHDED